MNPKFEVFEEDGIGRYLDRVRAHSDIGRWLVDRLGEHHGVPVSRAHLVGVECPGIHGGDSPGHNLTYACIGWPCMDCGAAV